MRAILIYDSGEYHEQDIQIEEFESTGKMVDAVNERHLGQSVVAAYEIYKKIEIYTVITELTWKAK